MQLVKNGSNLLGQGFQEINARRKLEIKPHLAQEYASICGAKENTTEYLFGDNLEEQLKKSKSASDLVRKFSNRYPAARARPYERVQAHGSLNFNRPSQNQFQRGGLQRGQMTRGLRNLRRPYPYRQSRNH